jgi:hypothetical protein
MTSKYRDWPEDRTEALGRCIDAGLSITKTARALHVARGAVSGRAHRLGWRFGGPRSPEQCVKPFRIIAAGANRPAPRPRLSRPRAEDCPVKVTCTFDLDTFAEITRRAGVEAISRPQVIRELVEWGLEVVRAEAAA